MSKSKNKPLKVQKEKPVIVTIHGFSSTPYENMFFINHINGRYDFLPSIVMLGSHGTNINDFRQSKWEDWQKPVEEELLNLEQLGYKNLSIIATSTGGTLLLEILSRRKFSNINNIVLVAPIIEPYNKAMRFSELAKSIGVKLSIYNPFPNEQIGSFYRELPLSSIAELNQLTNLMKGKLKKGVYLSKKINIFLIQSKYEKVVDPTSAYIVADGLKNSNIEILLLDSTSHLPVMVKDGVPEIRVKEMYKTFEKIIDFIELKKLTN